MQYCNILGPKCLAKECVKKNLKNLFKQEIYTHEIYPTKLLDILNKYLTPEKCLDQSNGVSSKSLIFLI